MSGLSESAAEWRRGSACLPSDCVEVAAISGYVLIRDSADKAGGIVLVFSSEQWRDFTVLLGRRDARAGKDDVRLIPARTVREDADPNYAGRIAGNVSEAVAG